MTKPRTVRQRLFASHVADGIEPNKAAAMAGYAEPRSAAHDNMALTHVRDEIARIQADRLWNEALPLAVNVILSVLKDEKAKAADRLRASNMVLDRTIGAHGAGNEKPLEEMTLEELQKRIEMAEAARAEEAKPVDATRVDDAPAPGDVDLFG